MFAKRLSAGGYGVSIHTVYIACTKKGVSRLTDNHIGVGLVTAFPFLVGVRHLDEQ